MGRAVLLAVLLATVAFTAGCVQSTSLTCADGRVCPDTRVCDTVHHQCVLPEQQQACVALGDGDRCTAKNLVGLCDAGFCIPTCGDGAINIAGEECDDGNASRSDGCSEACTLESPQWEQWNSKWPTRVAHGAAYDTVRNRLVVFGGANQNGLVAEAFERTRGTLDQWTASPASPVRNFPAVAYDPVRHVIVMFGGSSSLSIASAETWEYDGTVWMLRAPVASPPGRQSAAMTYDGTRGTIVMYGGSTDGLGIDATNLDDTWEYNGFTWTPIASTLAPPRRMWTSMAYDPVRARTVLFGGCNNSAPKNDTWELVAGQWTSVVGTSPVPRCGAALEFFPGTGRNKLVLFGGLRSSSEDASDTWEYGATGWSQLSPPTSPPGRRYHSMTFDVSANALVVVAGTSANEIPLDDVWELSAVGGWSRRALGFTPPARVTSLVSYSPDDQVLLFSGGSSGNPADTWVYGPTSTGMLAWRLLTPATAVPFRANHTMVYDSGRKRVVMFGGRGFVLNDETWEWNGTDWSQVMPATSPSAREGAMLAYVPERSLVVLFGGNDASGLRDDTWQYDGVTWTARSPVESPPPQAYAAMTYDVIGHRVVLFGLDGETWTYSDGEWTHLYPDNKPPARTVAGFVSDATLGHTLLYGGSGSSVTLSDLWSFEGDDWRQIPLAGDPPPGRVFFGFATLASQRTGVLFGGLSGAALLADTWLFRFE